MVGGNAVALIISIWDHIRLKGRELSMGCST